MMTPEFIKAIVSGDYNENDVVRYCQKEPSLIALFLSLLRAASAMIITKGAQGSFIWNLTERRFDFDNNKDLRLYTDEEFVRLQHAMAVVCDCIDELDKEYVEPQHDKEKSIEHYINGTDKETIIQAIKNLVCGKKGKQPAVIIAAAVLEGVYE